MKGIYTYISCLVGLFVALCSGCQEEHAFFPRPNKVEVVMSGVIRSTTTKVAIIPKNGLPTEQLTIGIVTSDYYLRNGEKRPDLPHLLPEDWGIYTYLDRGYFGGSKEGGIASGKIGYMVENGDIKYTNEEGTAIQNVFYDEAGMCYILRLIYPYEYKCDWVDGEDTQAQLILSANGSQVIFDVDGSQDIMSSDVAWGNVDNPKVSTDIPGDSIFHLSHRLVKFDIGLVAATSGVSAQYGKVTSVELINQPYQLMLDLTTDTLVASTSLTNRYGLVPDEVDPQPFPITLSKAATDTIKCGYVMALPAASYTFRIATEEKLSFYIDATFPETAPAQAGTAYPLIFKFLSTNEVKLEAKDAKEYWYDSSFN